MNMISTGAFLSEMDASNKQLTTAEKFAAVWEKKNAKAARAGGVSLMALSLAACGSSSDDTTAADPAPTTPTTPVAPAPTGITKALTTSTDSVPLSDNDDTVTSAAGTLQSADVIVDASATDSDSMTINFKTGSDMTVQPTITKVETIDVNYSGLTGAAFDATNVTGSSITINLTAATTDGATTVSVVGNNDVTAGTGVTTMTVTGLKGGVVDMSGVTTGDVTTAVIATNTVGATIKVDGDIALDIDNTLGSAVAVTAIEASADSVITLDASAVIGAAGTSDSFIGTGDGSVTLVGNLADIVLVETYKIDAITINESTGGATLELGKSSQVKTVGVTDNTAAFIINDLATGTVNIDAASTDITVSGKKATSDATVNVNKASTTLALDTGGTYVVNMKAGVETLTSLNIAGDTTLNTNGKLAIATLAQSATTDKITVVGSGDLTFGGTAADVTTMDASAATGKFTYTEGTAAATSITGSATGVNAITTSGTTHVQTIVTGSADDTITQNGTVTTGKITATAGAGNDTINFTDLGSLAGATLTVNAGAGDDTIKLGSSTAMVTSATNKITIDGGDGTDTISLIDSTDFGKLALTAGTGSITISNVEKIAMTGGTEIGAGIVSGSAFEVSGTTASTEVMTIVADTTSFTLDLSAMTFADSVEKTVFDASSQTSAMTITGSNTIDEVTLTGLGDTVSTGAGADQVTMDTADAASSVNLGAGNDTMVVIGNTSTKVTSVTTGAGRDTIDMTDTVITDTNKITVTDFTGGASGDILKLAVAANGLADGDMFDAGDSVSLINVATATTLAASAVSSGGAAYLIYDTAANISVATLNAAATGAIAIESDTGKVRYDADGDFTASSVHFATLSITGTLTADNFVFA